MSIIIPIIFGRNIKIYPKILLKSQVTQKGGKKSYKIFEEHNLSDLKLTIKLW